MLPHSLEARLRRQPRPGRLQLRLRLNRPLLRLQGKLPHLQGHRLQPRVQLRLRALIHAITNYIRMTFAIWHFACCGRRRRLPNMQRAAAFRCLPARLNRSPGDIFRPDSVKYRILDRLDSCIRDNEAEFAIAETLSERRKLNTSPVSCSASPRRSCRLPPVQLM